MTMRSKPSDWRSLDLEAAKELYDIDVFYRGGVATLVALASPSSPKAATDLDRVLRNIIGEFRVDLYFEDRPTTPQVRAALGSSPLAAAEEWLKDLDPDARRRLDDEAHWAIPDPQRESADVTGEDRLAALSAALEFGARCVRRAEARLRPGEPGRPRRQSVHDAVKRLREAWTAANGRDPKLSSPQSGRSTGAFLDFVRASLVPPLRAHGIEIRIWNAQSGTNCIFRQWIKSGHSRGANKPIRLGPSRSRVYPSGRLSPMEAFKNGHRSARYSSSLCRTILQGYLFRSELCLRRNQKRSAALG